MLPIDMACVKQYLVAQFEHYVKQRFLPYKRTETQDELM